jgi:glycosyltransferase involved in cell wall biosynthesis
MRILFPSIVDPRPHRGGAGAATRGLLSLLRRPPLAAEIDVVVPSSPLPHLLRQLIAVVRSSLSALPSKALFLDTRRFRRAVARMVATRGYDLVLINGGDLLWMVPQLPSRVPKLLYAHNLERDLFASQLDGLPAALRCAHRRLRRDLEKLARYELDGMRTIGRVLFISATDEARARSEAGGLVTLHVPPLFEYEPLPQRRRTQVKGAPQLGFLANFTWWPNRAALRWLAQQVLPRVRRDLRVHLFGEGSASVHVSDPRIVAHGFVNDVGAVFTACDVMLCPIVSGAGVSIKFAEALYNGVPVLATPFAARGLPLAAKSGVALADGAEEWVRFLDGEGLERLATEEVPTKTSRIFAPSTHAVAVHELVRDTVAGANDAARASQELRCAPSP